MIVVDGAEPGTDAEILPFRTSGRTAGRPRTTRRPVPQPGSGARAVDSGADHDVSMSPSDGGARQQVVPRSAAQRPSGRGANWSFFGRVTYVDGQEGARVRAELGAVVHDLLVWARADEADQETSSGQEERAA